MASEEKPAMKYKESWVSKNIVSVLVVLFLIALASGVAVIFSYTHHFSGDVVVDHERWGTFGDFFGGTLNPIFALFGLFSLLLTIAIQSKELSNSTTELATSARALGDQSKALEQQNFEATFFQMIRMHNDIVSGMTARKSKNLTDVFNGRVCFSIYYELFKTQHSRTMTSQREAGNKYLATIEDSYREFFAQHQADIGHYFRNLYTIVKFVHNSNMFNKKQYISILRAQLSSYELSLLFYNCLWSVGRKKFKPLIEEYSVLENKNVFLLANPKDHLPLYDESAYGELEIPVEYKSAE